jgi:hypothetical protein
MHRRSSEAERRREGYAIPKMVTIATNHINNGAVIDIAILAAFPLSPHHHENSSDDVIFRCKTSCLAHICLAFVRTFCPATATVSVREELGRRYIGSMAWKQLEPTPAHLTFIILSAFLILYALLSSFIRNRLHLSEPPLATLVGIIFGPRGLKIFTPLDWGFGDNVVQEFVR